MGKKAPTKHICRLLEEAFGPFKSRGHGNLLDSLIATILSQNTTDTNSGRAFGALKGKFPTWAAAHRAPRREIERAIASGGLAHTKSRYIKDILATLVDQKGRPSLRKIRRMDNDAARRLLLNLPGVGMKTASCVLLFGLGRAVCPVDTHVLRVARRLGLIESKATADQATRALEAMLPEECMLTVHLGLIRVGRTVCRPRAPRHAECPLRRLCATARKDS